MVRFSFLEEELLLERAFRLVLVFAELELHLLLVALVGELEIGHVLIEASLLIDLLLFACYEVLFHFGVRLELEVKLLLQLHQPIICTVKALFELGLVGRDTSAQDCESCCACWAYLSSSMFSSLSWRSCCSGIVLVVESSFTYYSE